VLELRITGRVVGQLELHRRRWLRGIKIQPALEGDLRAMLAPASQLTNSSAALTVQSIEMRMGRVS